MRPASIVNFERVVLLMLAVAVADTVINWSAVEALARMQRMDSTVIAASLGVLLVLILVLALLVSRRASSVARWLYVLLVGAILAYEASSIGDVAGGTTSALAVALVEGILALLSIWLLFRSDSRAWLGGARGPTA
jgi:uncharacterized membrane protein